MAQSRMQPDAGVSIIEVVLMLTISASLMAALTPTLSAAIADARLTRATLDMAKLKVGVLALMTDSGFPELKSDGNGGGGGGDDADLLVSDGDIPDDCAVPAGTGCGAGAGSWMRLVDPASVPPVLSPVDFLDSYLVINAPGRNALNAYGAGQWRGAYVDNAIDPDPWGNRYALSALNLNLNPETANLMSAGPDEKVETQWATGIITAGADDVVLLVQ